MYSDFVLDNTKKYIVIFKLNHPLHLMEYTNFGIISNDVINDVHNNFYLLANNGNSGLNFNTSH